MQLVLSGARSADIDTRRGGYIEAAIIKEILMKDLGPKEQQIMNFLHETTFDPILASPRASAKLKQVFAARSCAWRNVMLLV
jgi:hypothetical protein